MFDPEIINSVDNIYALLALFLLIFAYIIGILYNRYLQKKQHNNLISQFETQNQKLLDKMDELNDGKNSLDLQSSMDIISITFTKSMNKVMEGIRIIIEENHIEDKERKNVIHEKIKNNVNTQCDDDLLILGRIFYKDTKLSYYLQELDRYELIDTIYSKISLLKDKKHFIDVMDYIRNKIHTCDSISTDKIE